MSGLETFTLSGQSDDEEKPDRRDVRDAESFFNLPEDDAEKDDEGEGEKKA